MKPFFAENHPERQELLSRLDHDIVELQRLIDSRSDTYLELHRDDFEQWEAELSE